MKGRVALLLSGLLVALIWAHYPHVIYVALALWGAAHVALALWLGLQLRRAWKRGLL